MCTIHFSMNDEPVQMICEKDPDLKKVIMAIGDLHISLRTDYFASLIRSIIGQQISVSAAAVIYGRLEESLEGQMTAEAIFLKSPEALRQAGLTKQKIKYIKNLAERVVVGTVNLTDIAEYDDDDIKHQLIQVKGIGKWTAEVFLLLSLGRKDVLAIDDVGIQRAAMWLYQTEKAERRNILIEKSSLWEPYRSIAAFYLWEVIHLGFDKEYRTVDEMLEKNSQYNRFKRKK